MLCEQLENDVHHCGIYLFPIAIRRLSLKERWPELIVLNDTVNFLCLFKI